jgi:hypothetical protein
MIFYYTVSTKILCRYINRDIFIYIIQLPKGPPSSLYRLAIGPLNESSKHLLNWCKVARQVDRAHIVQLAADNLSSLSLIIVPDHDGGRPMEVNACILITHMVYL